MSDLKCIAIKMVKILIALVIGSFFSFCTIVCLGIFLPEPNPFRRPGPNLWLVGPIIAGWLSVSLWLAIRKRTSKKIKSYGIQA